MSRPGIAAWAAAALLLGGCVDEYVELGPGLAAFTVELVDPADAGTQEAPLPVPTEPKKIALRLQAWGLDGAPFPFTGRVRAKVTPGSLFWEEVDFVDGASLHEVEIVGVHSETRIWVVDDRRRGHGGAVGVSPALHFEQPTLANINAIPAGKTNTTSFFIEEGDRGDFVRMDRAGEVFADRADPADPCTLASPPPRKRDLVVTSIDDQGFYVTDLAEPAPTGGLPGHFGHLYVYNYNFPEGLEVGDRVESLEGSIQEFTGHTQISFPVYRASACPLLPGDDPEAIRAAERAIELATLDAIDAAAPHLDQAICIDGTSPSISRESCGYSSRNLALESLESAVVVLPEVVTPELWVRCDFDGDGRVSNFVSVEGEGPERVLGCASPTDAECACNLACQTSTAFPPADSPLEATHADRAFDATGKVCTERTGYDAYGQFVVRLVENGVPGPRINVATRDAFPDFDPELEENGGARLRVRGILQHVLAARPRWVVQARIPDERMAYDLCCLEQEKCPAGLAACDPN